MEKYRYLGSSPVRKDALDKVTGAAKYAGDYYADGLLYGVTVTSPHAHARILSIDDSKARELAGYVGIVTGADAPDTRYGGYIRDRHILCKEYVRYVGDYVAVVCAISEDVANQAASLVDVRYEELPAVFSHHEAFGKKPKVAVHKDLFH